MLEVAPEAERSSKRTRRLRFRGVLGTILRDLDIATAVTEDTLSPYHSAISIRDSVTGIVSNLMDVGYGASQVLPVILACLDPSPGPLMIEQPEIHLHPRAQGVVADLLCYTSKNRQVFIETHSVHMVNRARIMVAKGQLPHTHVLVNYVSRSRTGSQVKSIPILKNGDFGAEWPTGFFDERYQDTMALLKLKAEGDS
jgi:predicted ATPase